MTNKPMLSVEREFLEVYTGRKEGDWVEAGHELRALLDNPVVESEFEPDAVCTESDGCPTEGAVLKRFWRENQPDPVLCEFYEAECFPSLVRELVGHIAQLQDAAKRNVKPWEDTFPPTLLPAYIARINAEQPAPVAVVPDGYCIMPKRLTAENGAKALLLGEFSVSITQECPECKDLDEPIECCEICDGEGEFEVKQLISWDKIKYIYSEAVKGLALNPDVASLNGVTK